MSRRHFLAATGGLSAGLLLAACSTGNPAPPSSTTALPVDRIASTAPQVAAAETARHTAGQRTVNLALDARVGPVDIGGRTVTTWTYGGALPGKEIRVRAGDQLKVRLTNKLPQPTTIHWHGIALRNDMDGVPVLTQPEVAPRATFDYAFTAPHPGTYMFHPHVGTQLDRGLYGALIVDDPTEAGDYDQELVVVFDNWVDGTGRDPEQILTDLKANGMGNMGGMAGMSGMARSDLLGGDAGDVTYPFGFVGEI